MHKVVSHVTKVKFLKRGILYTRYALPTPMRVPYSGTDSLVKFAISKSKTMIPYSDMRLKEAGKRVEA
jgi:hypothetical protein